MGCERSVVRVKSGNGARLHGMAGACLLAIWSGGVLAEETATSLGPVTVTATRVAQPAFDVPASIDVIPGAAYSGDTLGVNLSEGLAAVPGLLARDRQNYAQDEQISVRGFGARSQFGVRSVRLYVDDIPATQPDGQGEVSHFNLSSAERVEVLRGPFSALYDNSSGGVIKVFTADGTETPQIGASAEGGSNGTYHTNLDARGSAGLLDYNVDYSHFHTDGYRDHSQAQRDSFNGKVNLQFNQAGRLTLLLNSFSSPEAQDPLGLIRSQFDANPSQSTAVSTQFNTRKSVEQTQGGAIYEVPINQEQSLRVLAYYGNRQVQQFLSIPVSAQTNPLSSGGVVNLASDYGGADARWSYKTLLAQRPFTLVAGLTYDDLSQHRRGYNNFVVGDGSQPDELGVQGNLRRDETDKVYNLDQYGQASWLFAENWSALLGVRHTAVRFNSADNYIVGTNGNDSGRKGYYATTPVGGILYKLSPALHLYASYGEGFETPALNELAYRPDQTAGLNFGLLPAHTNNGELGAKLRLRQHTQAQFAVFQAVTRNELVIDTNNNGRATYENAPRTRRQGVEASLSTELAPNWHVQLAYTYLDATVRQSYLTCGNVGTTCTTQVPVAAGNRIPGVPESDLYSALRWGGESGWHASLNGQYITSVAVNDVNAATTPSYGLLGVDGGYIFDLPHWRIQSFLRIDNLLDTNYIGSVIVNDGNGRYYEPGPGRSFLAGLSFNWKI